MTKRIEIQAFTDDQGFILNEKIDKTLHAIKKESAGDKTPAQILITISDAKRNRVTIDIGQFMVTASDDLRTDLSALWEKVDFY